MPKYKVEIELDLDFEEIFANIPEDLFLKDDDNSPIDDPLDDYYVDTIFGILHECYTNALEKKYE